MALATKQGGKQPSKEPQKGGSKVDISTSDILTVVAVLRMLFGRDPKFSSLLNKVDSPDEIEAIRLLIERAIALVD